MCNRTTCDPCEDCLQRAPSHISREVRPLSGSATARWIPRALHPRRRFARGKHLVGYGNIMEFPSRRPANLRGGYILVSSACCGFVVARRAVFNGAVQVRLSVLSSRHAGKPGCTSWILSEEEGVRRSETSTVKMPSCSSLITIYRFSVLCLPSYLTH